MDIIVYECRISTLAFSSKSGKKFQIIMKCPSESVVIVQGIKTVEPVPV